MITWKKRLLTASVLCTVASAGFVMNAWAAQPDANSDEVLDNVHLAEVIVNGERYIAGEYVKATNYKGILGQQDAMTTPLSVTTISEKAVKDFISSTEGLSSLLSLVPSVQKTYDAAVDVINIRGFQDDGRAFLINGIPGMQAMTRQSTNYIDSVDIIEGPSTGITGSSIEAKGGGTVNINSKKAGDEPVSRIGLKYHAKGAHEETVDVGSRFGADRQYGIRINAYNTDGERAIENWDLKQRNIYLNLDQHSEHSNSNFLIGYTYTDSQGRPYGLAVSRNYLGSSLPSAPDGETNFNPHWRRDKNTNLVMTFNHEQKLGEHLSAFFNAGHFKQDWYYYTGFDKTLLNEKGDFTAVSDNYSLLEKRDYAQIGLRGDFTTGNLKHHYAAGVDRQWHYYGGARDYQEEDGWSGNIYHPDTGSWAPPSFAQSDAYYGSKARISGWSVMDSIFTENEKLNILLGLNGKHIKKDDYNVDGSHSGSAGNYYAVSPSYGINYAFTPAVAVFANHTEEFVEGEVVGPNYTNKGATLSPYKTKQNELGVKVKTGDFFHKLSYFDIRKANGVDRFNDDGTRTRVTDGERRHKGLEYTAAGKLHDKWNLIGGVMYLDATQHTGLNQDGSPKASDGKRPNGIPAWTGNLGVEYQADDAVSGLLRANYVGSSYVLDEKYSVPGYFTIDAGMKYKTALNGTPVTVNAMCYNLTNKKYWSAAGNTLNLGGPRTVMVSAEFDI